MSTSLRRLGKYELQERLGHGGMAEVWKALDTQLQRYVAIKLLHADLRADPDFRIRFAREAQVLASLHHPNIVQIHDFQAAYSTEAGDTIAYMVMAYVEGETLAQYIHRTSHRSLFPPAGEVVHLFAALASAVDYAHQHGMVHRDIKPANILLDKRTTGPDAIGEPFLTDFGIAKLLGATTGMMSGGWQGTPLYTAPEQILGSPGNERSDIYSLGAILYEVCTGRVPFQGENPSIVIAQHLNEMPPAPASLNQHIPPALSMVILRCLAKDPAARFPSASSLAAALAEALTLPIPDNLNMPGYPVDIHNEPTHYQSRQLSSSISTGGMSSSLSLPGGRPLGTPPPATLSTPQHNMSANSGPMVTPFLGTPHPGQRTLSDSGFAATAQPAALSALPPVPVTPSLSSIPPSAPRKRRAGMFTLLTVVLLLGLAGAGLGTFLFFPRPVPVSPVPGGYAFFINSGQLNEGNNYGIEDQFQIVLSNIPNPAPGKTYYAWLLSDSTVKPMRALLLGPLLLESGRAQLHYKDPQKANLISVYSRFLITEDKAPVPPSTDTSTWRYYDAFPEIPDLTTNMGQARGKTALVHLRNLLSDGLYIKQHYGIHGGLDIQLVRNTQKVLEWAGSARDAWASQDAQFIRRQLTRILAYLDGTIAGPDGVPLVYRDVPAGTPLGIPENLAKVPLIETIPGHERLEVSQEALQTYLFRIDFQFITLSQSPGIRPATKQSALQIDKELKNLKTWLLAVHDDAKTLFNMTDAQLLQQDALGILDHMQTQANYAFTGQFDPTSSTVQPGVIQMHYQIQQLATFVIQPYKSH